jgi:hypothetical protein
MLERQVDATKTVIVRVHLDCEIDDDIFLGTLMGIIRQLRDRASGKEIVILQSVIISSGNPKLQKTTPMSEKVAFVKSLLEAHRFRDVIVYIGCTDIIIPFGETEHEKKVINYIVNNPVDFEITTGPSIELAAARASLEFLRSKEAGGQKNTTLIAYGSVNNWYFLMNRLIHWRWAPAIKISPEDVDDERWQSYVEENNSAFNNFIKLEQSRGYIEKFLSFYNDYLLTFYRAIIVETFPLLGEHFKLVTKENYPHTFKAIQETSNSSSYKEKIARYNRTIYRSMAKKIVRIFRTEGNKAVLDEFFQTAGIPGASAEEREQKFKEGEGVYHDGNGKFSRNFALFRLLNNYAEVPDNASLYQRSINILTAIADPHQISQMDQIVAVLFCQLVSIDASLEKSKLFSAFETQRLLVGFSPIAGRFVYSEEKNPPKDTILLSREEQAAPLFYASGGPMAKPGDAGRCQMAVEIDRLTSLGFSYVKEGWALYDARKKPVAEARPEEAKGEEDDVVMLDASVQQGPGVVPLAQGSSAAAAVLGVFSAPAPVAVAVPQNSVKQPDEERLYFVLSG